MGKTTPCSDRKLVLKVLNYFENEKKKGSYLLPIEQAFNRACLATGLSVRTLMRIKKEAKMEESAVSGAGEDEQSNTSKAPIVRYTRPVEFIKRENRIADKKLDLDTSQLTALRNLVESYKKSKGTLTLRKILFLAKRDLNFPGGLEYLRNILVNMGYNFYKISKNKPTPVVVVKNEMNEEITTNTNIVFKQSPLHAIQQSYIIESEGQTLNIKTELMEK